MKGKDITTNLTEIKWLQGKAMNSCTSADQITQMKWTNSYKHTLPKLTQEEIENINRTYQVKRLNQLLKTS